MSDMTLQQKVDCCQAFLDLEEMRDEGLIILPGSFNRESCQRFIIAAKRQGVTPSDARFAIGRGFMKHVGGDFTDAGNELAEEAGAQ